MAEASFYDNNTLIHDVIKQKKIHPVLKDKGHLPYEDIFIKEFYQNISAEDIKNHEPSDLYALALAILDFTKERQKGKPKIRIYHPSDEQHSVTADETILEIISDDKPFIIDSLIEALNRLGLNIKLLIHPIFNIERDSNGVISSISGAKDCDLDESVVQIRFDERVNPSRFNTIIDEVKLTLSMVDLAVRDWQQMIHKMDHVITETKTTKLEDKEQLSEYIAFLQWLQDGNFIYLGFEEYDFKENKNKTTAEEVESLGIFLSSDERYRPLGPEDSTVNSIEFTDFNTVVEVTKSNKKSLVHRPVHMDYIIINKFNDDGKIVGEYRFIGLFTSVVYYQSSKLIPIIRTKIQHVKELSGLPVNGYSGKALASIIESLPRDELFQASEQDLLTLCMGIVSLSIHRTARIFIREDKYKRFLSCMVFVPKTLFSTRTREKIEYVLEDNLKGTVVDHYTMVTDSPLARVNLIVKIDNKEDFPVYSVDDIEDSIEQIITSWQDKLLKEFHFCYDKAKVDTLFSNYSNAFSAGYIERYSAYNARWDVQAIEETLNSKEIKFDLYETCEELDILQLKIFNLGNQLSLSDIMPILENMGLNIIDEHTYQVQPAHCDTHIWIHHFRLKPSVEHGEIRLFDIKKNFETVMKYTWEGIIENDFFNQLVIKARVKWRDIIMLRSYAKFLRQIRFPYSQDAIEKTFATHPNITSKIVELFKVRFSPEAIENRDKKQQEIIDAINESLVDVSDVTQDRIILKYIDVIKATVRTNFFQLNADGKHKEHVSYKFLSEQIPDLPLPFPYAEIFVYSSRVEGTHLRGGKVARGGLRWSDRKEDFRTEVLGLMKAQMTKNTVIVPVGSKGGFVVKQPPSSKNRNAFLEEGIECYKTFLRGLLDITDNIVKGSITPPQNLIRHDGDDPYLVVAADKGTATFSDIANSISAEYNFWLDDAFASGGSAGYDHKKMGITAKGAWVSVQRHFREMGINIQKTDFTVVGIGDMGGDVFGNGMLLSEHIRLVAAFNHMHIFIDPNPDAATSFAERKRLFEMPRSSWDDYNRELMSDGGGIFRRNVKSIKLTEQIKTALDIMEDELTPEQLIQAILKSPVDLLWNGGIGTYIKSTDELHTDVGDRANDGLRVNGKDLQCKVIGEGGNLGVTQLGRIEYTRHGGRMNTDFIDNSAGVDCSDKEVNIKIALKEAISNKSLDEQNRNDLLEKMTDNVSDLVLYDNICQAQAITIQELQGHRLVEPQQRLMHKLERDGSLNRSVEHLPEDDELSARIAVQRGLTRPELSVLLSYSKLDLYDNLLDSQLPDEDYFIIDLKNYFPRAMQNDFKNEIVNHPLRREIVATIVTNSIVNRLGSTFYNSTVEDTGFNPCDIARAYVMVRDAFELRDIWHEIESLNEKVPVEIQVDLFLEIQKLVERTMLWFLRNEPHPLNIEKGVELYRPSIKILSSCINEISSDSLRSANKKKYHHYVANNVPFELAKRVAVFEALASACDIAYVAQCDNLPVDEVGKIYFELGALLNMGWLRQKISELPKDGYWERLSCSSLVEDTFSQQMRLTSEVIATKHNDNENTLSSTEQWAKENQKDLARYHNFIDDIKNSETVNFNMLVIATKRAESICNLSDKDE